MTQIGNIHDLLITIVLSYCKFEMASCYCLFDVWNSMLPLKIHDFLRLSSKAVKIHDGFLTIQASNSNSGLFKFIYDCDNSVLNSIHKRGDEIK